MINRRLFDWYGIDTKKNLQLKSYCPRPFDTVLIDKQGSCYLCECTSWLPQSAGNLYQHSLYDIINSDTAKQLQDSIVDNSYRYCNNKQCSYLLDNKIEGWPSKIPLVQIKNIRLAIDNSCNLRCPSCRTELIFIKKGKEFERRIQLADKINAWLHSIDHPVKVHIGSDGDPFASHVYRHFMTRTPVLENIKYSLLTNGLMFKEFSSRIPHIIENLSELGVSIDGASQTTYENLRLGGTWNKINSNLQFISKLKKQYDFTFRLHFVVQKDNYHEMEKIINLGKKYNADRVWLSRIQDWNSFKNFKEHNIFDTAHPLHTKYQEQLIKLEKFIKILDSDIVEEATLRQLH
jgi:MoaA/NifB/PqqE/SkfB family radical SAM enzyme